MGQKRNIKGSKYVFIFMLIMVISSLTACRNDDTAGQVSVIHRDSFVGSKGVIYEDIKNINYKSYFDYHSKTNLLLCYDSACNHSSIKCTARQSHPYTFYTGDKLFYIDTNIVTYTDYSQAIISCLYKCDVNNPETEAVAEFEGRPVADIYIRNNILYIIAVNPMLENGQAASNSYDLFRIKLSDNSITRTNIPLKGGLNENYIPLGMADNKIILYRRYYDRIINPSDYGLTGDLSEYSKNNKNYTEYMKAAIAVFHEEIYCLDLSSGKLLSLALPVPLSVHNGIYYYNKKHNDGSYSLMAYSIGSGKEKELLNSPAYAMDAIGNTLFITEGVEQISDITHQRVIDYDKNKGKYFLYNITSGEIIEINKLFYKGTDAQTKLITEDENYYIFLYSSLNEGISQRIGYIRKEDFHNGGGAYKLAPPI